MTFDINGWWGVTVRHGEKVGPKRWRATALAFRRDTQERVGSEFVGFGTTMNTADNDALRQGKSFVISMGMPADWSGPGRG